MNSFPDVILASSSPRRRELLTLIGVPHTVVPADIDERVLVGETPSAHAERLARSKAEVVSAMCGASIGSVSGVTLDATSGVMTSVISGATADAASDVKDQLIVAADTIVVVDGDILGKPIDRADAVRMLTRLQNRTHTVVTGIASAFRGTVVSAVESVEVTFRALSEQEINDYVATGEPMDKAGAYGIQGFGATIVREIDGDYFAVMGLSLVRLVQLWKQLGVEYRFGVRSLG